MSALLAVDNECYVVVVSSRIHLLAEERDCFTVTTDHHVDVVSCERVKGNQLKKPRWRFSSFKIATVGHRILNASNIIQNRSVVANILLLPLVVGKTFQSGL